MAATRNTTGAKAGHFSKLSEMGEYTKTTQGQMRRFALNVDLVATVIQTTLARAAAKQGINPAVAKFKARRAVRQFRRAAGHLDAAADCMGKGWHDIQQQFAELINPRPKGQGFNFKA
jgi:hypothetical protein